MSIASQVLIGFGIFVVWACIAVHLDNRRLRKIADSREEESICTFVRALEYRRLDTKVIRSVYEELQDYFLCIGRKCPFRPSDRLEEDLRMDDEDLADLFECMAAKAGRSTEDTESNPFFDQVKTVGDLIEFFCCQSVMEKDSA